MEEQRRYIRLNSVFPVEFSLYFTPQKSISDEYEGFTCNVSEGGLCLTARNLKDEDEKLILQKKVRLRLAINIPLYTKAVNATAEIAWVKKDDKDPSQKTHLIGLSYKDIKETDRKKLINYARRLKWLPRVTSAALVLLSLGLLLLSFNHMRVRRENEFLVKRFVTASEVKGNIERQLNEIKVRKDMLESVISKGIKEAQGLKSEITDIEVKTAVEKERLAGELNKALAEQQRLQDAAVKDELSAFKDKISSLQMELAEVTRKAKSQVELLQDKLSKLQKDEAFFKDEILTVSQGEVSLEEQLDAIRVKNADIEKASIDAMTKWIKTHRAKKTGLVLSYEGDKDIKDWAFTYDQALTSQVFLISGDYEEAAATLNFYKNTAKRSDGLFYNAYDVKSGLPSEYVVHSGPNIWIAISACQYTYRAKDKQFLMLAEDIAVNMIRMQRASADGGIKGGPGVEWVSTEHNLDAYALFNMLYKLTGREAYREAASVTLTWLKDAGYNRPEGRFMRGKGDSTIATDTFSWAIAAIGPGILKENGMDPDRIMEFAENECRVEAEFMRPEEKIVDVVGFDFAKAENLGRGGIVSTEWTAQMIGAFKIMSDYYRKLSDVQKEKIYRFKAQYYLSQLGKMAISSPSPTGQGEGCLPYASIDNVDTGHGWRVAKGRRTGSVAATSYYIFAYKGHNPLGF